MEIIPTVLTCAVCKGLYSDPVLLPCCGNSVCRSCADFMLIQENTCWFESSHAFPPIPMNKDQILTNPGLATDVIIWKTENCEDLKDVKHVEDFGDPIHVNEGTDLFQEVDLIDKLHVKEKVGVVEEVYVKEEMHVKEELDFEEEIGFKEEASLEEKVGVLEEVYVKEEMDVKEEIDIKEHIVDIKKNMKVIETNKRKKRQSTGERDEDIKENIVDRKKNIKVMEINKRKKRHSTGERDGDIKENIVDRKKNIKVMEMNKRKKRQSTGERDKKYKTELYCLLCQEYGHVITNECVSNPTCIGCGVRGHVRRDCPSSMDMKIQKSQNSREELDQISKPGNNGCVVKGGTEGEKIIGTATKDSDTGDITSDTEPTVPSLTEPMAPSLPKQSNYNFIFIEVETIQASNSSQKQLTQIGCRYLIGGGRFFNVIKPKELDHYLDDFKKDGDLLQLLNMQKNDAGHFEFRKMFEITEKECLQCVEEFEALLSLSTFLGENCVLFSQLETNLGVVLRQMNHYGINTDFIKGFCTWKSFLKKTGEEQDTEFDDWYKEKSIKPIPEDLNAGIVADMVCDTVVVKIFRESDGQTPDFYTILLEASVVIDFMVAEITTSSEIQESEKPIEFLEFCSSFRPDLPVMITMQRLKTLHISDDEDSGQIMEVTISSSSDDDDYGQVEEITISSSDDEVDDPGQTVEITKIYRFTCPPCNFTFSNRTLLVKHLRSSPKHRHKMAKEERD